MCRPSPFLFLLAATLVATITLSCSSTSPPGDKDGSMTPDKVLSHDVVAMEGAVDRGADLGQQDTEANSDLHQDDSGADTGQQDIGPHPGLYQSCTGHTFFPTSCDAGRCAAPGLATTAYEVWQKLFKSIHGLSDADFNARITISNVDLTEGPIYVFWRVDYVFSLDWVRSRQNETANLGSYPLSSQPTNAELETAIILAIESAEQFDLASVATRQAVESAFDSCIEGMVIDWCHIEFVNVTGELLVRGIKEIDLASNKCKQAAVDVESGVLAFCQDSPCWIN